MKIKTKLIILLLAISLIPILSIVTLTRISVLRLSSQISDDIQNKQLNDFINELEVNVHNYKELIKTAGASTQFILKVQAQEVEKLLAKSNQPEYIHSSNTKEFGLDNSLATPQGILSNYPTATSLDYQGLFFTEDAITADIKPDLARLQDMTQIYH